MDKKQILKYNKYDKYNKYYYQKSDMRIKENISDSDKSISLEKILKIPIKTYNYINDPYKVKHNGIIAQDLASIIPNAVHVCELEEFEDLHTIEHTELISYLIQSIQKLNEKIEVLEEKIEELTNL